MSALANTRCTSTDDCSTMPARKPLPYKVRYEYNPRGSTEIHVVVTRENELTLEWPWGSIDKHVGPLDDMIQGEGESGEAWLKAWELSRRDIHHWRQNGGSDESCRKICVTILSDVFDNIKYAFPQDSDNRLARISVLDDESSRLRPKQCFRPSEPWVIRQLVADNKKKRHLAERSGRATTADDDEVDSE